MKRSHRIQIHLNGDGCYKGHVQGEAKWSKECEAEEEGDGTTLPLPPLPASSCPRVVLRLQERRGLGLLPSDAQSPPVSFLPLPGLPVSFCGSRKGCFLKLCFWKHLPDEKAELTYGTGCWQ